MKFLALAVLLAIIQVAPPVPRKAADKPNSTSQNVADQGKGNKNPPAPPSIENAPHPDPQQRDNRIKQPNDDERSISIRKLPPVSVAKDGWDVFYICLTALLVGVGIATFIAIWIQAVQTKHAAKAAQKSAEAMERQSEFIVAQNRAWLVLTEIETPHGTQKMKNGWVRSGTGFKEH